MKTLNELNFVKSYKEFRKLPITRTEKELLELVLSYQTKGQQFYMNYSSIAEELDLKTQSIKNMICNLKKLKFLFTENSSNFNGINGGSTTKLRVNVSLIETELDRILNHSDIQHHLESIKTELSTSVTINPDLKSQGESDYKIVIEAMKLLNFTSIKEFVLILETSFDYYFTGKMLMTLYLSFYQKESRM